jgi:hypothetical protein
VLLYNIQATALTEIRMRKMEAAHRRHLRRLLKLFWPKRVRIEKIYELAGTHSIRKDIWERKLNYLRHALIQPRNSPARESMEQYFRHFDESPKPRGSPMTIHQEMKNALGLVGVRLNTWGDLQVLRGIAEDYKRWMVMSTQIVNRQLELAAAANKQRRVKRHAAEAARNRRLQESATEEPTDDRPEKRRRGSAAEGGTASLIESPGEQPLDECVIQHAGLTIRLTVGQKRPAAPDDLQPPRPRRVRLVMEELYADIIIGRPSQHQVQTRPIEASPARRVRRRPNAAQRRAFERQQLDNRPSGQEQRTARRSDRIEAMSWGVHGRDV